MCFKKKKSCLVIKRHVRVNRKRALHTASSPEEERLGRALIWKPDMETEENDFFISLVQTPCANTMSGQLWAALAYWFHCAFLPVLSSEGCGTATGAPQVVLVCFSGLKAMSFQTSMKEFVFSTANLYFLKVKWLQFSPPVLHLRSSLPVLAWIPWHLLCFLLSVGSVSLDEF